MQDFISITWHIRDVLEVRPDLTPEQAREVLTYVSDHHDANLGVTWDTLEFAADVLFRRVS